MWELMDEQQHRDYMARELREKADAALDRKNRLLEKWDRLSKLAKQDLATAKDAEARATSSENEAWEVWWAFEAAEVEAEAAWSAWVAHSKSSKTGEAE